MSTKGERSLHGFLDLPLVSLQIFLYLKVTWLAWVANSDHVKWCHSLTCLNLGDLKSLKTIFWCCSPSIENFEQQSRKEFPVGKCEMGYPGGYCVEYLQGWCVGSHEG